MTTNQTIDGVPRELRDLLERVATEANHMLGFTYASNYDECRNAVDELRALLDAPAVESELDRLRAENERLLAGFYQLVTDADIKKISDYMGNPDMPTGAFLRQDAYDLANMTTHMCREVQALRIKVASQRQGEPVAYRYREGEGTQWRLTEMPPSTWYFDPRQYEVRNLYEQLAPAAALPDGHCIMPRQLTAENGAKALLLGEFKLLVTKECPECCELEEPVEGCSICDGEGDYGQKHTIPWDQIKFIYSKAVSGLAVKAESTKSR